MNNEVVVALTNTIFILFCILVIGLCMELIQTILIKILSRLTSPQFAYKFINRITFIGVVHHELSHALFTLLTGAKITKINLFKPDEETGTLGTVEYSTRGIIFIRCWQYVLISAAPVICGAITSFLICIFGFGHTIWQTIILGFILLCIVLHMSMSGQDIKVALKGLPLCMMFTFLIFYFLKLDLFSYVIDLFI